MTKCSIFVSAISSSIFGPNDWTFAQNTLRVFGCVCMLLGGGDDGVSGVGGGGGGGDDDGGDGEGGGGGDNGGDGDDVSLGGEMFRRPVYGAHVGGGTPSPFPHHEGWDLLIGPELHLCCYNNTGTKYPSTLAIEMQTIFNSLGFSLNSQYTSK